MTEIISREIRLKNRPFGMPKEDDFELAEVLLPKIKEGEVLVRNIYMSVDPYMRGRMNERGSYAASFQLGKPLEGGCVGQVQESRTLPRLSSGSSREKISESYWSSSNRLTSDPLGAKKSVIRYDVK